jgi:hypothetical protein
MAKKESLKSDKSSDDGLGAVKPPAGISQKAFGIIKLALGICLLPVVYAFTLAFLKSLSAVDRSSLNLFWAGGITFLLLYLFVWEPAIIYAKGQRLLEIVFTFFKPLVKVAPYLLPIYTIILFAAYSAASFFNKDLLGYFVFFFGFTMALHLVFSARSMRSKQGDLLKANYIFGFSFIYIVNILITALILNLLFDKYSFVGFFNSSYHIAKGILHAILRQVFLI